MNQLTKLLRQYYTDLYKNQLGLKDYQKRVTSRLNEEKSSSQYNSLKYIKQVESLINVQLKDGKKILIVGAGTGTELMCFLERKCDAYAIEPNEKAFEILKIKTANKIKREKILPAVAENLPFKSNFFDFVYCFTVLEHVQNVKQSIQEMVRVIKKGAYVFIACPDYRYPWEGHYKMILPLFLPKIINQFILILNKRDPNFLKDLQMVNANQLKKIFDDLNIISIKIRNFFPQNNKKRVLSRIDFIWKKILKIDSYQYWLLKK